ncbi:MAG: hypothetical protein OXD40_09475 [bacterium]|nr:hypothetical protein [bacterium]
MYQMGIDATSRTETAEFGEMQLGANITDDGAKVYQYVQADEAIANGALVAIKRDQGSTSEPEANDDVTTFGVATAAFAVDEYGWVQVWGASAVRAAASCASYELLFTHAGGDVDDDTSTNAGKLAGIVLTTDNGTTDHEITPCWLSWPHVTH